MSGIFGVVSKKDCIETLFYGTDYHSHLGTEYGGIAVLGKDFIRRIHDIRESQFKSKFYPHYKHIKGNKGIGVISALDEQPVYSHSKLGPFCIVTNGFIENIKEKKGLFSPSPKNIVNTTELVAKLISQGTSIIDGIEKMFNAIDGSCSLLLLNKEGIYAARDRFGYSPLVVGKGNDGWAITTETTAFPNIGFEMVKYIQPGEIVLINEEGMRDEKPGGKINQTCAFLWIYIGFPTSSYEGINVETVRERCGQYLARGDKNIEIDLVCGVPDSGIAHAIGYTHASGKPYRRPLIKYTPGYGRSYIPPSQKTRNLIAKMKLIPVKEIIEGNRILLCEDSIVRGTQLKNFTIKKLWSCHAKEIHIRVACPPLMFPCRFNVSTRNTYELIARRAIYAIEGRDIDDVTEYLNPHSSKYKKMVEWIANDLKVTTLKYQTIDDMAEAIGLPKEKLCLYCWRGDLPKSHVY